MASQDLLLETLNPIENFVFTWKIQNFSKTEYYDTQSAEFRPSTFVDVTFVMGMKCDKNKYGNYTSCSFYLRKCFENNVPKTFRVQPKIKLYSSEEKCIREIIIRSAHSVHDNETFVLGSLPPAYANNAFPDCFFTLTSDILIVKCHLELFGHCMKFTSNASVPAKKSRTNFCNLSSDFKALYDSKMFSDITVRIGKKVLRAHQTVLVARSSVFKSMLESDFIESKSKSVTITDADFDVFECFLKYLYSGDIDDTSYNTALQLYALADKYAVSGLLEECGEILASNLTVENVCEVLELAYLHSDLYLNKMAINFITLNFAQVRQKSEWGKIMKDFPELSSEVLGSVASLFGTLK